ncbi:MAG: hypothetical protein MK135_04550 [Polyangiaceae bacterium]|nr:hypothetical protein [Polyangiaceae bacterium]
MALASKKERQHSRLFVLASGIALVATGACSKPKENKVDSAIEGKGNESLESLDSNSEGQGGLDIGADSNLSSMGGASSFGQDAELVNCQAAADCCKEEDGCTDADAFICTVEGFCGAITKSCQQNSDCQGDTYCCKGELCRADGSFDGVCISAAIPPGLPCGNAFGVGEFSPDVQCEWTGPKEGEFDPESKQVLATPLVMDLPYDSGAAAELIIITTRKDESTDASSPGVIRILNGQDCSLQASVGFADDATVPSALATPAAGDIDGDGIPEIAIRSERNGDAHYVSLFRWNGSAYVEAWTRQSDIISDDDDDATAHSVHPWAGPSLHDLDNDGIAEIILESEVWDAEGNPLYAYPATATSGTNNDKHDQIFTGLIPVIADFDGDGKVEIITQFDFEMVTMDWDPEENTWNTLRRLGDAASHFAVADFGTPNGSEFDHTKKDGIPEVVGVDSFNGEVIIRTLSGREVMTAETSDGGPKNGGPPVIGDFDADGMPEIGVAGGTRLRVFDLDCPNGCGDETEDFVLWSQPSQDATSGQTGGTIFDFDGDGKAEMVYADECFLRVYSGEAGEVLFSSYRTSATWYESPLVADIDNDENTELVINSNDFATACPKNSSGGIYIDPIHPGVKCSQNDSCPTGTTCGDDNLCAGCETDNDCCDGLSLEKCGLTCADRLPGSDKSTKVCRATHPGADASLTGIRVLRDRLDRWASSRPIWNQHAYTVTNVSADTSVPSSSERSENWLVSDLNNFRANVQGVAGFDDLPDITGRLEKDNACVSLSRGKVLRSTVCNRGRRAVGAELPATFYKGDPADGEVLCTSKTDGPVKVGNNGCSVVECEFSGELGDTEITVVVNDDGSGRPRVAECRPDNNRDTVTIDSCSVPR